MDTDTVPPWHLRGNWEPVLDEITGTDLRVEGNIPRELDGLYVRTGPNPVNGTSPHWFYGDGMVHGIRLRDGRADWYRNRFVETEPVRRHRGERVKLPELAKGTGNTHVIAHNGSLMALEEGHWPWLLDGDLNTTRHEDYGGALTCSMTAHPKVCPDTGELLAFSYFSFQPPYLHYVRVSPDGKVSQLEPIDIPRMVMMHDFNVTQNHVVFMDLPVCFDLGQLSTGFPFRFDRGAGARLGVMPRNGTNADVQWLEIDPCYVFHPVNAHEEDGRIVLHVSRMESAFGDGSNDYAEVGRLTRWTIDPVRGTVDEQLIDGRAGDFGRVDDRLVGKPARFAYLMALDGEGNSEEPVYGSRLLKYDLHTGACTEHQLGEGVRGGEPVFAPRSPGAAEDDGWVMAITHDENTGRSALVIVDARDFAGPPVARVHLPRRVPYGAHGSWVPDGALR
ncbi:MAG: carotenoid oxygenase family protein [Actinomycetes bacterium]